MVHTGELFYPLDGKQELATHIRTLPDTDIVYDYKKDGKSYRKTTNKSYSDRGITSLDVRTIVNDGFCQTYLKCRVNFSKLAYPDDKTNKIDIITPFESRTVEENFNKLAAAIGMPLFEYWTVHRLDYCIQVKTPYVKEYIKLFKKGDRKGYINELDGNNNRTDKPGSLYLVRNTKNKRYRGFTINFYDKYDQLSKEEDTSPELLEASKDILRLEVQCFKPKLEYIKKKYNFENKLIINFLDENICEDIIGQYIKEIIGDADYHRKSKALKRIENAKLQTSTKRDLKQIIEAVAKQHQSIDKVRKKGILKADVYNRRIKQLYEMNINPVTISDTAPKMENKTIYDGLPSIYPLFIKAVELEAYRDV